MVTLCLAGIWLGSCFDSALYDRKGFPFLAIAQDDASLVLSVEVVVTSSV